MSISVQDGFAPLIAALSTIESIGNPRTFDIKFVYGLPLLNPALIARAGGNMKSVRVILDVIASINPADVATAQDYINTHKENSPGGSGGGSISGGAKPAPPPPPPPSKPKPPIISAEVVAGPDDDFFTPVRFYGQGFAGSEAVALMQVLGGSQSALAPAASDPTGHIDVTISLAAHTHYNVYAVGATSNVPSNTIGIDVP